MSNWYTLSQDSGVGDTIINVTAESASTKRMQTLKVTAEDKEVEVQLIQHVISNYNTVVCYYYIENLNEQYKIFFDYANYSGSWFDTMSVDGGPATTANSSYRFNTTGWHTIEYTFKDKTTNEPSTVIPKSAFRGKSGSDIANYNILYGVDINDGITEITYNAFAQNDKLQFVNIADSVEIIGGNAFWYNKALTSIVLPESVTRIDGWAFSYCSNLVSVTLPSTLTDSGFPDREYAQFYGCTHLESINIPSGVTWIPIEFCFNCERLANVYTTGSIIGFDEAAFANCGLSNNSVNSLLQNAVYIGEAAFSNCDEITSISIGNITSMAPRAFEKCDNLQNVTWSTGSTITKLPNATFSGCTSLTGMTLPNNFTEIGDSAFDTCYSMTSIVFPSGLTTIGDGAFRNCTGLLSLSFPNTLRTIQSNAFNMVYTGDGYPGTGTKKFGSISTINLPSNLGLIGDNAFNHAGPYTAVTIPASVYSMGLDAFSTTYNYMDGDALKLDGYVKEIYMYRSFPGLRVPGIGPACYFGLNETENCVFHYPSSGSSSYYEWFYNSQGGCNLPANWTIVGDL